MTVAKVRTWTTTEYHRMIEAGILTGDDRVELLEGQILEVSPQQPPHAATTQRVSRYLDRLLAGLAQVRMQLPVTLGTDSEPEPDIAVVRIDATDYAIQHPSANDVFLLVEISDSTLSRDRKYKAQIYARAGIPDYWVLDVNARQIHVFRQPEAGRYGQETVFTENALLSPLTFPGVEVGLNQLFLPPLE